MWSLSIISVTCLFDITIFIVKSPPTQLQTHCMNGERIMTSRSDACVAHTYAQKDPIKQENKRIYNAQMRAQQGFRWLNGGRLIDERSYSFAFETSYRWESGFLVCELRVLTYVLLGNFWQGREVGDCVLVCCYPSSGSYQGSQTTSWEVEIWE